MTTPRADGFYSHGEHDKHQGTIIIFPERSDIWREGARVAQHQVITIANIIINYEDVYFCVKPQLFPLINGILDKRITIIQIDYDDIWARDIAPNFVCKGNEIRSVCWGFNSWGGIEEGAYFPWDKDAAFAQSFSDKIDIKKYIVKDVILEGGAVITDGEGTLLTTKSVLLNSNRNPNISIKEMEAILSDYFCIEKVIWFSNGLFMDETDGHIDNLSSIVRPGEVCLAWTDDINHPQYSVSHNAYDLLSKEKDAKGRSFIINKIPLPTAMYITKEEAGGMELRDNSTHRVEGFKLVPSYLNYYVLNNALLLPVFGCDSDTEVIKLIKSIYVDREIIPVNSREFLLGGGGLHCILHEIPSLEV